MEQGREERGSVVALVALLGVLAVVMTTLIGGVGVRAVDRSRAQSAADAAALAGAAEGRAAASRLAAANGAVLVEFTEAGSVVEVGVVTSAGTRAHARAERRLGTGFTG